MRLRILPDARTPRTAAFNFSRTLYWSFTVLGLIMVWIYGKEAFAACSQPLDEVQYSATFNWKAQKMSIQIGLKQTEQGLTRVAHLISATDQECQAICQTRGFETEESFSPVALTLSCSSPTLESLQTPAVLIWADPSSGEKPTLRFGSWVQGYREAALDVQLDTYSKPASEKAERKPAIREPGQIAPRQLTPRKKPVYANRS